MHPKLVWTQQLATTLGTAMGTSVQVTVRDEPSDPLKKYVDLKFGDAISGKDYNPIQTLAHAFAKKNDCVVFRIRRIEGTLSLEVGTKTRLGRTMDKNPFEEG